MGNFCPNCGSPTGPQCSFCPGCGSALKKEEMPVAPVVVQTSPNPIPQVSVSVSEPSKKGKEKKKKAAGKKLLAVAGILLSICLAAFVFVSVFFKDGSGPSGDEASGGAAQTNGETVPASAPERTVMIYVVGSDLESQCGAATLDIQEMIDADLDPEKNHVLVFTGGARSWKNDVVSSDENAVLLIGEDDVETVASFDSENMGKSKTLTGFLEYCEENYPAERYSLILWNHGGGPVLGYGLDELYDDVLSLEELSDALGNSPFGSGEKLEILGFDACLMGSLETAWAFREYADYFLASQEVEPGYGWDYRFLEDLDSCKTGADLGEKIIDRYFEFYEELFEESPRMESEITLSCTDLSEIEPVSDALENLFSNLEEDVSSGNIGEVSRCRYRTKAFGKSGSSSEYDLVDLRHLISLLPEDYEEETEALEKALEDYVVYSRTNAKNANGVSLYHPYDALELVEYAVDVFEDIDFAPEYTQYIQSFSDEISGTSTGNYRGFSGTAGKAVRNGQESDLSIQLTEEQQQTFSGAQYYVFKELPADVTFSGETEYLHIFSGQDAVLSADGTLSATYQGKAVFGKDGKSGKYSDFPLSMYQIYDGTLEEKFYFPCMFWLFGDDIADMDLISVNWLMKIKDGVPKLLGAYDMMEDSDRVFPDKFLIDSNDYSLYTFANNSYTVRQNEQGNVELVFSGSSYGFEYERDSGFSLELRPVDYDDGYYAVFVIEDIYGNTYTSSFFPLG